MPSKPDQFLVFDLDGTISDPAVGIGRCINYALSTFGYPAILHSEISRYIGPPLDASFAQITGRTESTHVAELVATYRERYADVGYAEKFFVRRHTAGSGSPFRSASPDGNLHLKAQ